MANGVGTDKAAFNLKVSKATELNCKQRRSIDEVAHNEPPHLNLHYLHFSI